MITHRLDTGDSQSMEEVRVHEAVTLITTDVGGFPQGYHRTEIDFKPICYLRRTLQMNITTTFGHKMMRMNMASGNFSGNLRSSIPAHAVFWYSQC